MPDHDPRSEAEKARADLKRNSELGTAVSETPLTHQPSVTPDTFGVHDERARLRSGSDQGVEAGGRVDKRMEGAGAPSIAEAEQRTAGRDSTAPSEDAEDAMSRAKE